MLIGSSWGKDLVLKPKEDEVIAFLCFLKAGLRFSLHKMIVAVLKRFNIYWKKMRHRAISTYFDD
jgi:hypothetical protein